MEQRDALGIALDIGALDRKGILASIDIEHASKANSIFDLIDALPVQERSLVEHDARVFPAILRTKASSLQFGSKENRQVRVYVSDKTKLEKRLGIDLLIYQSRYDSFILMQYKAMEKAPFPAGWSYLVDGNLEEQLRVMERIRRRLKRSERLAPSIWGMRLNGEPFYFKFCERMRPQSLGRDLVQGITLSSPHVSEFLSCPEAKSQRGGLRIGYENCPRYLTNTEFTTLARGGWIGSSQPNSVTLAKIVSDLRRRHRSQMYAIVDSRTKNSASYRQSLRTDRGV
jgi:hypothetical protein